MNQQEWRSFDRDYASQRIERNEWRKMNEQSLREMWDTFKHINIHVRGVSEEVRKRGAEKLFEEKKIKVMPENVPNFRKSINGHIQEAQWTSSRLNTKKDKS